VFTGIVEGVGRLKSIAAEGRVRRLDIEAGEEISTGLPLGASVAVNGCCLTVVAVAGDVVSFEAIPETLERTSLGDKDVGARVNLERALAAAGRLDGHLVQGHVDGMGRVASFEREDQDVRLAIACGPELAGYLVPKGSVTIDGVSLTVVHVTETGFDVALIPHTLAVTTLGGLQVGDRVNLEVDIIGKYVRHFMERAGSKGVA